MNVWQHSSRAHAAIALQANACILWISNFSFDKSKHHFSFQWLPLFFPPTRHIWKLRYEQEYEVYITLHCTCTAMDMHLILSRFELYTISTEWIAKCNLLFLAGMRSGPNRCQFLSVKQVIKQHECYKRNEMKWKIKAPIFKQMETAHERICTIADVFYYLINWKWFMMPHIHTYGYRVITYLCRHF